VNPHGKLIRVVGAMALAILLTPGALAQMGGGMMGGSGGGGGMMGHSGPGSEIWKGIMSGAGSRDESAQERNDTQRDTDAVSGRGRSGSAASGDTDPLERLDLSRRQRGAIYVISEEFRDRQSNLERRLAAEERTLRALYDEPERNRANIDRQFQRIDQLRREMFEASVAAHDRVEAQLTARQRQRLRRIAPRWNVGG